MSNCMLFHLMVHPWPYSGPSRPLGSEREEYQLRSGLLDCLRSHTDTSRRRQSGLALRVDSSASPPTQARTERRHQWCPDWPWCLGRVLGLEGRRRRPRVRRSRSGCKGYGGSGGKAASAAAGATGRDSSAQHTGAVSLEQAETAQEEDGLGDRIGSAGWVGGEEGIAADAEQGELARGRRGKGARLASGSGEARSSHQLSGSASSAQVPSLSSAEIWPEAADTTATAGDLIHPGGSSVIRRVVRTRAPTYRPPSCTPDPAHLGHMRLACHTVYGERHTCSCLEMPKSPKTEPSAVRKMLPGLRSRCSSFASWCR